MKPDFEKAAKEIAEKLCPSGLAHDYAEKYFLAGCEHAYSIDKETIERLEAALRLIQEWQMNYVELSRTTEVYKIAEKALTPDN